MDPGGEEKGPQVNEENEFYGRYRTGRGRLRQTNGGGSPAGRSKRSSGKGEGDSGVSGLHYDVNTTTR